MGQRQRFRMFRAASIACAALGLVTLVFPDWIELVFRVDPDHGNGGLEWLLVLVLWAVAVVLGIGSLRARRAAEADERA